MVDRTINSLPSLGLDVDDEFEIQQVDDGPSGKVSLAEILSFVPLETAWGNIVGDIDNQTDLIGRLDQKADIGAEQTAVWGQITGDLNDQNDLWSALQRAGETAEWGEITGVLDQQADLRAELDRAGDTAVWGQIQGNILLQDDLQQQFNTKVDQTEFDAHVDDENIHFADARIDDTYYARRNNAWVQDPIFDGAGDGAGWVPDPGPGINGYFLEDSGEFVPVPIQPVATPTAKYNNIGVTPEQDPGSGNIGINNADPALATEVYVSSTVNTGNDIGFIWDNLDRGDILAVYSSGGSTNVNFVRLTEPPIPQAGGVWYTVRFEELEFTGPLDGTDIEIYFLQRQLQNGTEQGQTLIWDEIGDRIWTPTNVLKIDENSNVLVQNKLLVGDRPDKLNIAELHVWRGAANFNPNPGATLALESPANENTIHFMAPGFNGVQRAGLLFGDEQNSVFGHFLYDRQFNQFEWRTGGAERAYLDGTRLLLDGPRLEVQRDDGFNDAAVFETGEALSLIRFDAAATSVLPEIGAAGNHFIVRTGNEERLRVLEGGNVLINTTASLGYLLRLKQLSAALNNGIGISSAGSDNYGAYIAATFAAEAATFGTTAPNGDAAQGAKLALDDFGYGWSLHVGDAVGGQIRTMYGARDGLVHFPVGQIRGGGAGTPFILRNSANDSYSQFWGGVSGQTGANVLVYGADAGTEARIQFRIGGDLKLNYQLNTSLWHFRDQGIDYASFVQTRSTADPSELTVIQPTALQFQRNISYIDQRFDGGEIQFRMSNLGDRNVNAMKIKADGQVQIGGTDSPQDSILFVTHEGIGNPLFERRGEAAGGIAISFRKARGLLGATREAVQDGDTIGGFAAWGYDGATYLARAQLVAVVDGPVALDDMPMALHFRTGGTSTAANRLVIDANGVFDFQANLLKNALDPVDAQDVATKAYVDAIEDVYVNISGDTMTGPLNVLDDISCSRVIASGGEIIKGSNSGTLQIAAGTAGNVGPNIVMYGSDDATRPFDWRFRSGSTDELRFEFANKIWNFVGNGIRNIADPVSQQDALNVRASGGILGVGLKLVASGRGTGAGASLNPIGCTVTLQGTGLWRVTLNSSQGNVNNIIPVCMVGDGTISQFKRFVSYNVESATVVTFLTFDDDRQRQTTAIAFAIYSRA